MIRRKIQSIHYIRPNVETNIIIGEDYEEYKFPIVTQKFLYEELLNEQSRDHVYQTKWTLERNVASPNWDKIWKDVHDNFITEDVKSTIWEQIHLNFYTTYNYNKWHNTLNPCPLCNKIPEDIFHVILECAFTIHQWKKMEKTILKIVPNPITMYEMAFGLHQSNKSNIEAKTLRNWLTFSMRHYIIMEERVAYHRGYSPRAKIQFEKKMNRWILQDLKNKCIQYKSRGLQAKFDSIATVNNVISTKLPHRDHYIWF